MSGSGEDPFRSYRIAGAAPAEFELAPDPENLHLTREVSGTDHEGAPVTAHIVTEVPLTIFLNAQEIVTAMTLGDHPELLAVGFLANQGMIEPDDELNGVDFDAEAEVVVVRTGLRTDYEKAMEGRIRTSGCAVGTIFSSIMERLDEVHLDTNARVRTSWLYEISRKVTARPSLYLKSGAIHGCALCSEDRPLVYVEDVGRHNAADKIAGWIWVNRTDVSKMLLYTTGRLTGEMVLKTVRMGIPTLVSRSGFTAHGVELARKTGLTLIGRVRGRRFLTLSGEERLLHDANPDDVPDDPVHVIRKGASPVTS